MHVGGDRTLGLGGALTDLFKVQNRTPKPKNRTNSTKEFSEQVEGGLPVITQLRKGCEANRTRKFSRKSGKIFVAQVLWGTSSVPDLWLMTLNRDWR